MTFDLNERITKTKLFIDQYNWKEIKFSSHQKDWKKIKLNNKSIALNVLYVPYNTEKIRRAHKSKYNLKRESQGILLIITDGDKWHYLAVKKLSDLFRGITSNNNGDFYCTEQKISLKSIILYAKIMIIVMWECLMKTIKY